MGPVHAEAMLWGKVARQELLATFSDYLACLCIRCNVSEIPSHQSFHS